MDIQFIPLMVFLSLSVNSAASADNAITPQDWQIKHLIFPTEKQRLAEQNKVFIYDGLYSRHIDDALDKHFERMENMMFVRVKTMDNGSAVTIDDGCDD